MAIRLCREPSSNRSHRLQLLQAVDASGSVALQRHGKGEAGRQSGSLAKDNNRLMPITQLGEAALPEAESLHPS